MNQLGLNPILLVGQIINFGVLFYILHKLVYKTILEAIDKRANNLKQANELIENAKKEAAKQEEVKNQKLAEFRQETTKIVKQAKQDAEKEKEDILNRAKKQAKEIAEEARLEVAKKEKDLEKRLKENSLNMAVEMAKKLIKETLDASSQRHLINRAIKSLKKVKS